MALQPCRECGKEISTEASACPHCGAGHPTGESGRCYGCGETVTVVDNYCPLCGVEDPLVPFAKAGERRSARLGTSSPPVSAAGNQYAGARRTMWRAAFVIWGLVIVVFTFVLFTSGPSTPTTADDFDESSHKVSVAIGCEQAIEQRLRSPRSARFPWNMSNEAVRQPDGSYVLRSYVDAQNGFGAEIRTNFVCRGTPTDGGVLVHEARLLD